jgi:hypothetical protein
LKINKQEEKWNPQRKEILKCLQLDFPAPLFGRLKSERARAEEKKVSAAHAVVRKGKFNCDLLLWGLAARTFRQGDNAWLLVLEKM